MKLRFTARAVENLTDIADYLYERNPTAMGRVRADIYTGLQNLLLFPSAGRLQDVAGVRNW
ncbi:MAG: type II toxin-antitoxin system RelE/ParE family toxin [Pseudolabrys sp.]